MALTRFWLIRHGEPVDGTLSKKGRAQMASVADHLANEPIAAIYTSTLNRAIESARILAEHRSLPVHIVPDLREIDFGDFEGLTWDEIAARFPDAWRHWMEHPTEVRFPNGECFSEMRARVLRAFETIVHEHEGQTIAIVSHAGVNRILIAWALQMPHDCIFRLAQDYAAVNLLSITENVPGVELLNYSAAAKPPAPQKTAPSPE